ncbi:hypothetical protein Y1Q_0006697 [Alligator mississippiensis]|uniref:Uncharacterized protein n=1 Tax=Alligator mississippiensis TaxID=8496 RepID=A0A151NT94_ALLMI|nr:hypothetical protein Y1Q_0006697 [Alligator mississippiensis]
MPDPVREDPMNRQMEEAQAPETDIENLEDGIFVPEPACEVEVIAEERPRTNLPNTSIIKDPKEFFGYLISPAYEISSCDFIDDEAVCMSWKHTKERYTVSDNTNIFIACFTTAYARLELYELLDSLQDRCLYHDTDSVIFVSLKGGWNPSLGDYLGELTSEISPDEHITEFVLASPKTYGYKLSGGKVCLKVKEITLNVANSEKVNFETLRYLVLGYGANPAGDTPKTIVIQ